MPSFTKVLPDGSETTVNYQQDDCSCAGTTHAGFLAPSSPRWTLGQARPRCFGCCGNTVVNRPASQIAA